MLHAGIAPDWTREQAVKLSAEVEAALQGAKRSAFFSGMYGDTPTQWSEALSGVDRLRFITNVFTRMRICDADGNLDLGFKRERENIPEGFIPWFTHPKRKTQNTLIVFGHWAALGGVRDEENRVIGLDTGCVWGQQLTAWRADDDRYFSVTARQ